MSDANFRVLCAGLLRGLDENKHPEVRYPGHLRLLMDEARTALKEVKGDPGFYCENDQGCTCVLMHGYDNPDPMCAWARSRGLTDGV